MLSVCLSPPRLLPPVVTTSRPRKHPLLLSSLHSPGASSLAACLPFPQTRHKSFGVVRSSAARNSPQDGSSPWDDKPYISRHGTISYLDEQDIITLLDPPEDLFPIDPSSYNPAVYLWKKVGDIPEERRHRLLFLVKNRLISRIWQTTETRYVNDRLTKKSPSDLLYMGQNALAPEIWNCRASSGPLLFSWLKSFQKVLFRCNGGTFGRILLGGPFSGIAGSIYPLYFKVREVTEVMPTEQPCDLSYEFGDGLLDLPQYPTNFPKPAKHPWPFNDQIVIYIRHAGPGVVVGQAWQEGKELEQVPRKFCGEILMVKEYTTKLMDI